MVVVLKCIFKRYFQLVTNYNIKNRKKHSFFHDMGGAPCGYLRGAVTFVVRLLGVVTGCGRK